MKKTIHFIFFLSFIGSMNAQTSNLWTPQGMGLLPPNHDVLSISVVNKDVVWALADSFIVEPTPSGHRTKILKTTNGGATWRVYKVAEAAQRVGLSIQAIDSSVAWITSQDFGNGIGHVLYKTTNGGLTWTPKATGYAASYLMRFFDTNEGIIWNRHAIARTMNGGETWTTGTVTGFLPTEGFATASVTNAWAIVGDSIWAGTTIGRAIFSPNRGVTWQFQDLRTLPNFAYYVYLVAFAFRDARNGIALGLHSTEDVSYFAQTNNGGTTWTTLSYPFTIGKSIEYIKGTKGGYVITDFDSGFTAYTTNSGQSWVKIDSTFANATQFLNPQTGWIGGSHTKATSPAMYKWNGGSILSSIKIFEPEELSLKISPNPTSRYLTVSYSADFKPTELTLYDLGGKTVFNKKDPSVSTQVIDLEGLSSGIYLLQLKNTEGVVAAQKVVVER